jgi:hypothetical protein
MEIQDNSKSPTTTARNNFPVAPVRSKLSAVEMVEVAEYTEVEYTVVVDIEVD